VPELIEEFYVTILNYYSKFSDIQCMRNNIIMSNVNNPFDDPQFGKIPLKFEYNSWRGKISCPALFWDVLF